VRSDDDVVAAAKRGDPDAWAALYRAHAGRLLLWLETRVAKTEDSPDDLASESWLVAAQKIADFHGTSSEFAGWLFGIARNHAANARRRRGRRQAAASAMVPEDPTVPGPETAFTGAEWVREALASLPDRERDVVTCLDVLELGVATTSEALGISAVAVRVARHRGLKRLRAQLPAATESAPPAGAPALE
jgi:RNA polymerase sigma-70 factor (ECF subfamily)